MSNPAMNNPKVAIILVNWQTPKDTIACIESLRQIDYANYFILVVDNGSIDDSVLELRRHLTDDQLILLPENLGFAGGNNVGIREALSRGADAVWLLNSDTEVAPDSLTKMAGQMVGDVGIVGSLLYFYEDGEGNKGFSSNKTQFNGGKIIWRSAESFSYHLLHIKRTPDIVESDYAHGASMLVRTEVFKKIGYLPEFYFLNYEETDFCCAAKKAGFRIVVHRQAKVWHKVGASMGSLSPLYFYYMHRNMWFFMMRNAPLHWKVIFIPRFIFSMVKGYVVWKIREKSRPYIIFMRAMFDAIFWRTGKATWV